MVSGKNNWFLCFAGVTDLYHITANSYADSDSFVGSEAFSVGYYSQDGNK